MESEKIPSWRAYYLSGMGHLNCAKIVHSSLVGGMVSRTDSSWIALSHIIGFAVEAALKSYLAGEGITKADLQSRSKGFGHNLSGLLSKCEKLHLDDRSVFIQKPRPVAALRRYIELCGKNYAEYDYRYIEAADLQILREGEATLTVFEAISVVLDLCDRLNGD